MSTLRVLVVSAGSIGRRHLRVARALLPDAQIHVLRRPQSAGQAAPEGADGVFGDLAEAVAFAPQIAIVATPAPFRIAIARALHKAGAHLLLEKPLAADASEARAFQAEAAAAGPLVRVGYNLRFAPLLVEARARLAAGEIGAPRLARFEVGQYLPDWRPGADYRSSVSAQAALGGGVLLELSHEIDLALWMLGQPETVCASLGRVSALEIDVEDFATLILERPGLSTTVQLDFLQRRARRRVQLIGSKATLELDMIAQAGAIQDADGERPIAAPKIASGDETYLRQLDAFCAEALEGYAPRFASAPVGASLAEASAALEIVEAARRSSQNGARIRLGTGAADR